MPANQPGAVRLFRFAGIDVFVHWSWLVVAVIEVQARQREAMRGVHAQVRELVGDRPGAQGERHRPLVAHGKERVGHGAVGPARVEEARVALPEARRVCHEPACVDRGRERTDLAAHDGRRDRRRHGALSPAVVGGGKFIQSTKICSKSGWAASETCWKRAATCAARARSGSESRQICAPSDAALPT